MNAIQLVKSLLDAGYLLSLNDGNVRFHYERQGEPDRAKVEPLILELKEHKADVIELLKAKSEPVQISEGRRRTLEDVCDVLLDKSRDIISRKTNCKSP